MPLRLLLIASATTVLGLFLIPLAPALTDPGDALRQYLFLLVAFALVGGLPWFVYNLGLALAVRGLMHLLRMNSPLVALVSALALWTVCSAAVTLMLREEERSCDSVCLGLEMPVIPGVPMFLVGLVLVLCVGVVQAMLLAWNESRIKKDAPGGTSLQAASRS